MGSQTFPDNASLSCSNKKRKHQRRKMQVLRILGLLFSDNSSDKDVHDEENTEEETENDGYVRSVPSTSTASPVPEAATYESTDAAIMDEPLRPRTSAPVSAIQNLHNASELSKKFTKDRFKSIPYGMFSTQNVEQTVFFRQMVIPLESHPCRGTMVTVIDLLNVQLFKLPLTVVISVSLLNWQAED
ncbi:hypothetical protein PoB_005527500 [Plakobranchus ocellatus]|uniref:Uncharacterized protein n=1 Tax=Plakobranchus ocellatus TaxID=259542 RepID=A0AAV4CBG4_9GAST|nr:hypothetical protein PoB_005527500 [Plakobranchus ocellatus]